MKKVFIVRQVENGWVITEDYHPGAERSGMWVAYTLEDVHEIMAALFLDSAQGKSEESFGA